MAIIPAMEATHVRDGIRRVHSMPFGAQPTGDGRTRFRLWAPAARSVELWLEGRGSPVAMRREPDGWASLLTAEAPPGTRYRFRIDGKLLVPDPASRFQPDDVHGPSEVVDPGAHVWADAGWTGVPAERLVFYELHVGTFTPEGTFAAAAGRLDHLVALGVTAIELMPVADFPGRWGWGYDGVLPFAPEATYGRPADLKRLVEAAHRRGLAVFLDVVYNHFGPEGNYLHAYAPAFFTPRHKTPWGDAINFDGPGAEMVRAFVVHNALYWLEEYGLDGLRLDAVHAIRDDSEPHILLELARAVAAGPGRARAVHLVLENDEHEARYLARDDGGRPRLYLAQWTDDVHHTVHVRLTGERDAWYADYDPPMAWLCRSLAAGVAYQGERSPYRGRPRGEPTQHLPPTAFVTFLQNHDQIGNRALGERIHALAPPEAVRAATALHLLAPQLPLLFMGQEWGATRPFPFFSDLGPPLGEAVSEGRRREFARFSAFADPAARARIPDPQSRATRDSAVLDWTALARPPHREWLEMHRALLRVRRDAIVPLLAGGAVPRASAVPLGEHGLEGTWSFPGSRRLRVVANLGASALPHPGPTAAWGRRLFALELPAEAWTHLPPWSVGWYLADRP
jgi:malto-oligosyltrehalose trehalohydrolase